MTAAAPHRRSEAGTTLIELVVTVAIMGFAMLAIMGGIGTSIIFADVQRKDATSRLVLTSAAEKIVSETEPDKYQACATTYPAPSSPAGYVVTVEKVTFWEPRSNRYVDSGTLATANINYCNPDLSVSRSDSGLQLITLKATSMRQVNGVETAQVETIKVVKRQVEP